MSWSASLRARVGALTIDVALDGAHGPVAVVGPNGSGKTTLLRWLAGAHLEGAHGVLKVGADTLVDTGRALEVPSEERRIGYLPQGYGLFPHLSVIDNVAYGLARSGAPKSEGRERARALLESLGVGSLASRHVKTLSGGEGQRVALARALIVEPRMLLLDEPLSALDPGARREMREFLAGHLLGRGCILVTHDPRDVRAFAERVFVMEHGQIVQSGTVEAVCAAAATPFVSELFDA